MSVIWNELFRIPYEVQFFVVWDKELDKVQCYWFATLTRSIKKTLLRPYYCTYTSSVDEQIEIHFFQNVHQNEDENAT